MLVRRGLRLVVSMAIVFVVTIGGFWSHYVLYGDSPYDEVGIDLNSNMPPPLRDWACAKLHARFPGSVAPYGCTWDFHPERR